MEKKLLIDAAHPEETRVVVAESSQTHDFDFESNEKAQITGNIYLAKVTRVEPSLQAAFLDYGGNRHGFLAFSEIHPDYYQIPLADKEALLAEQLAAEESIHENEMDIIKEEGPYNSMDEAPSLEGSLNLSTEIELNPEDTSAVNDRNKDNSAEILEEDPFPAKRPFQRKYKIQEVIKVRQILLVQVTKEERGNKGAALTTYLSIAGRYCVLMPNTSRGGGISKKITVLKDRIKLKKIIEDLWSGRTIFSMIIPNINMVKNNDSYANAADEEKFMHKVIIKGGKVEQGVFDKSIKALKILNKVGYGVNENLNLNLVYNPIGPSLPPSQDELKKDYKKFLNYLVS